MKKYTAKEIVDNRISFLPMSEEQYIQLLNHFKIKFSNKFFSNRYTRNFYIRFYLYGSQYTGASMMSYLKTSGSLKSSKEISFEEFDFTK